MTSIAQAGIATVGTLATEIVCDVRVIDVSDAYCLAGAVPSGRV